MFAGTPRHLRAQDPARDEDRSLVLPESHTTFSLLPECLAARFPGELDEVEAVVAHAEQAPSLAAAANELRRDAVELPGAMRWVGRRVRLVHHVLSIVIGLLPEYLVRCIAEMGAVRTAAPDRDRAQSTAHPGRRAAPRAARTVGVPTPPSGTTNRLRARQHKMGPDPPPALA